MVHTLQYSATLDIYLVVGDRRIEVESCYGNRCTLRSQLDIPPSMGELVIVIDGEERRRSVFLKGGVSQGTQEIELDCPGSINLPFDI